MINAKAELLKVLNDVEPRAAFIKYRNKEFVLKRIHFFSEWLSFLGELDFLYDDGYGGQELEGTVWLPDGTWIERGEYDGAEWWEHKVCPELPEVLK